MAIMSTTPATVNLVVKMPSTLRAWFAPPLTILLLGVTPLASTMLAILLFPLHQSPQPPVKIGMTSTQHIQ